MATPIWKYFDKFLSISSSQIDSWEIEDENSHCRTGKDRDHWAFLQDKIFYSSSKMGTIFTVNEIAVLYD